MRLVRCALLTTLCVSCFTSNAFGASHVLVLVQRSESRSAVPSETEHGVLVEELLQRTVSELRASRFDTRLEAAPESLTRAYVLSVLDGAEHVAIIHVLLTAQAVSAQIWVRHKDSDEIEVQNLESPWSEDAAVDLPLAIVEALLATLVELKIIPPEVIPEPPETALTKQEEKLPPKPANPPAVESRSDTEVADSPTMRPETTRSPRVFASLGPAALLGPGGIPPAGALQLDFAWCVLPKVRVGAKAEVSTSVGIPSASGSSRIRQRAARLAIDVEAFTSSPLSLMLSAAAGAYQLDGAGETVPPLRGVRSTTTTFMLAGGASLEYLPVRYVVLAASLEAAWLTPRLLLRAEGSGLARSAEPLVIPALRAGVAW